ncbi:hypothetical protein B484DRAFT_416887, partial [Ochromonadaceae sp. CCMP2298]
MKSFKTLLNAVRGKKEPTRAITPPMASGLTKALVYIEGQNMPRGLYREPGFIEEIGPIEGLICSGKISQIFLSTVRSTHSIACAVLNVLSSHDPLIPYALYDHFMSPLAHMEVLIVARLEDPLFEAVMRHLAIVVRDCAVPELAAAVGVHMLRGAEDELLDAFEVNSRVTAFSKLLSTYISYKHMQAQAQAQDAQRGVETPRRLSAERLDHNPHTPTPAPSTPVPAPIQTSTATPTPATTPAPTPTHASGPGTIQERSVKVVFFDPLHKPTQEELRELLGGYGTIANIGYKPKLAVVLFAHKREAQACARYKDGNALGDDFKIKYLGGPLPVDPAGPGPSDVGDVLGDVGGDVGTGTGAGAGAVEESSLSSPLSSPTKNLSSSSWANASRTHVQAFEVEKEEEGEAEAGTGAGTGAGAGAATVVTGAVIIGAGTVEERGPSPLSPTFKQERNMSMLSLGGESRDSPVSTASESDDQTSQKGKKQGQGLGLGQGKGLGQGLGRRGSDSTHSPKKFFESDESSEEEGV